MAEVLTEGAQGGLAPVTYRVTLARRACNLSSTSIPCGQLRRRRRREEFNLAVDARRGARHLRPPVDGPAHPRYLVNVVNGDPGGLLDGHADRAAAAEQRRRRHSDRRRAADRPGAGRQRGGPVGVDARPTSSPRSTRCARSTTSTSSRSPTATAPASRCRGAAGADRALRAAGRPLRGARLRARRCRCSAPAASRSSGAASTRRAATRRSTTRGCACCPASGGPPILVPPSGHVCGIFARSDTHARRAQGAGQRDRQRRARRRARA